MIYDRYSCKCRNCGERMFRVADPDGEHMMSVHAKQVPNADINLRGEYMISEVGAGQRGAYLVSERRPEGSTDLLDAVRYGYVEHSKVCKGEVVEKAS